MLGGDTRDAGLEALVERLVDATGKRHVLGSGWHKRLREPAAAARDQLRAAIARIPGLVAAGASDWSRDATLRAIFAQPADIAAAFSADRAVQAYFSNNPRFECIAMLALQEVRKRVLAHTMHGDMVLADVARTAVSFSNPRIFAPAADEVAVREELLGRAFEHLGLRALEASTVHRAGRQQLEQERGELRRQLDAARRRGAGFSAVTGADTAATERELAAASAALGQLGSADPIEGLVAHIGAVLADPAAHIRIEPAVISLDAMNFEAPAPAQAITPRIAHLWLGDRGPYAVVLACFPRAELRPASSLLEEAAKML
jgi:hypothetical protein